MKLSVVIPAHNEEGSLTKTVQGLFDTLSKNQIDHEILVINDNSSDGTEVVLQKLQSKLTTLRYLNNPPPNGFGFAVRYGLENFSGDAVAIFMADCSDDPNDLVRFFNEMSDHGVDCVFGDRWSRGGKTFDYPLVKRLLNRTFNRLVSVCFGLRYSDVTNAFKLYRADVIEGLKPFLSHHFNLTLELPLKAIIRGYTFRVLPNSWTNRKEGIAKLKIREMGSRYLFILVYCLIEKWLSRGDYHSENTKNPRSKANLSKKVSLTNTSTRSSSGVNNADFAQTSNSNHLGADPLSVKIREAEKTTWTIQT
ncbi:MAG: glycosyltransferase family 2 protein [Bdellovibrionales bacterium CG10_big_fil_rev_8_21_14_0_10_45_34]|nr:MAG: glycosyltransferase family 2 protein [Bdellovibrionales bacterium CG10_big_fil_rev_8_21_14_0_10_45_34]